MERVIFPFPPSPPSVSVKNQNRIKDRFRHMEDVLNHVDEVFVLMNKLLDVEVSRQPSEVQPVTDLPFHVAPSGLPFDHPNHPAIPIRPASMNVPNGSVLKSFDGLDVVELVPPLGPGFALFFLRVAFFFGFTGACLRVFTGFWASFTPRAPTPRRSSTPSPTR